MCLNFIILQCTFIVLSNELLEKTDGNEIASMVGDTNLFLNTDTSNEQSEHSAEIEIMVAEKSQRGKKIGVNALCMMINYGIEHLRINKFEAKIKCDNEPSIKLFKKLGFKEKSRSEVFKEITFLLCGTDLSRFQNEISSSIALNTVISEYKHD